MSNVNVTCIFFSFDDMNVTCIFLLMWIKSVTRKLNIKSQTLIQCFKNQFEPADQTGRTENRGRERFNYHQFYVDF